MAQETSDAAKQIVEGASQETGAVQGANNEEVKPEDQVDSSDDSESVVSDDQVNIQSPEEGANTEVTDEAIE